MLGRLVLAAASGARQFDDAILHLRNNELQIGTLMFKSAGDRGACSPPMRFSTPQTALAGHEIRQFWKRVLKRIDVTSRSLVAVIEPGSCFVGTLAELVFASDRSYMLIGPQEGDNRAPAALVLTTANFDPYPMANGLSRLATRFLGEPDLWHRPPRGKACRSRRKRRPRSALSPLRSTTSTGPTRLRLFLEERASFSPDALTGMEANLRFPGPEP